MLVASSSMSIMTSGCLHIACQFSDALQKEVGGSTKTISTARVLHVAWQISGVSVCDGFDVLM